MKIRNMLTALAVIVAAAVSMAAGIPSAQEDCPEEYPEYSFGEGEKLTYVVSYRAALVPNMEAGEITIRSSSTTLNDKPVYNVYGNAKVFSHFKWFFDLNDTYQSWLDKSTLKPLAHSYRIREGKHRVNCDYAYDWENMGVSTYYHNLKREKGRSKYMRLTNNSMDPMALFANFRSQDMSGFTAGKSGNLRLVLDDTIRTITYTFCGREQHTVKKIGTFNALKFSCTIATSSGESFEDGSEFFLWVTDDKNKMPLYLESPIKVGSVRATLTSYSNLKYSLTAKIK